jgi:hypothetical protein
LIPLSDFYEPTTGKKYGVKADAETLDILNTVAKQKEVISSNFIAVPVILSYWMFAQLRLQVYFCRLWWL